ncbi:DDE Tnp 1 7 domain-containing protein, partial [Aphis craccivora]
MIIHVKMTNLKIEDIEKYLEEIPDDADVISDFGDNDNDSEIDFDPLDIAESQDVQADYEFDFKNWGENCIAFLRLDIMIEDDIWTASTSIAQNMPSNDIISNSNSEDIDRKISKPTRSKKNKKSVHTTQNDNFDNDGDDACNLTNMSMPTISKKKKSIHQTHNDNSISSDVEGVEIDN